MGKMNKNIYDLTVNSKPLLRDLEVYREFMTGYSWQDLSWEMYCIEDIAWWHEDEYYFIFEW